MTGWTAETEFISMERKGTTGRAIIRDEAGDYIAKVPEALASLIVEAPALRDALGNLMVVFASSYKGGSPTDSAAYREALAVLVRIEKGA